MGRSQEVYASVDDAGFAEYLASQGVAPRKHRWNPRERTLTADDTRAAVNGRPNGPGGLSTGGTNYLGCCPNCGARIALAAVLAVAGMEPYLNGLDAKRHLSEIWPEVMESVGVPVVYEPDLHGGSPVRWERGWDNSGAHGTPAPESVGAPANVTPMPQPVAQPAAAPPPQAPPPAAAPGDPQPVCPEHQRALPSKFYAGFFCPETLSNGKKCKWQHRNGQVAA